MTAVTARKCFITCPANQYLFQEGQEVTGAYFIYKGEFKIVGTTTSGRQQIVRLATDGQILGHRGYGDNFYPIGAISLVTSQVCYLDNDLLYEIFMNNPSVTYQVMRFYADELRKSELRTKFFGQMNTSEKIMYALIYASETFGLSDDKFIRQPLSRLEYAEIAGTNAEQVSRTLSVLKKRGLIKLSGRRIGIPHLQKLKAELKNYHLL